MISDLAGDVDSLAGADWAEDWGELDTECVLVLLGRRPGGLHHLVGCLAADGVEVVVAGDSHVDVGAGEVGPVILEDRLVADGLTATVQERRGAIVPTEPDLI